MGVSWVFLGGGGGIEGNGMGRKGRGDGMDGWRDGWMIYLRGRRR